MPNRSKLYWSADGVSFSLAHDLSSLVAKERPEIEACDAQTVLLTANISAATWFLGIRQDLSDSFRKYAVGFANSYRRKKFKCMLLKVFAGEEWEQKVLKALRFDLIILCCLVLGPDQFEMVKRHGLQGVFAEQVNNDFEERSPHIPDWIANASKTIARDSSLSKNAAAKTLEQALESPLPNSQLFLEFVEEVVEEVLECHAHDSHLESTQNSEQARVTSPNSTTPASAALPPKPPPHSQTEGSYHGIVMPPTSQYNDTSWAARSVVASLQNLPASGTPAVNHTTSDFARPAPKNDPFRNMTIQNLKDGNHTFRLSETQGRNTGRAKRRKRNAESGPTSQNQDAAPASQQIHWDQTYRTPMLGFNGVLQDASLPSGPYSMDTQNIMGDINSWQPFLGQVQSPTSQPPYQ